jgi:transcriptional regulator with XRE-family HTH domain
MTNEPKSQTKDFSHLNEWLTAHLDRLNMSVEDFAEAAELTRTSVYFYMQDKYRPDEQSMVRMCTVLGVPLEEGLAQYTPRKRGRPRTRD